MTKENGYVHSKKSKLFFLVVISLSILVTSCTASPAQIQNAIEQTRVFESSIETAIAKTQMISAAPKKPLVTPTIASTPTPSIDCEQADVDDLTEGLDDSIQQWKELMSVAEQTSKIALSPVIVQLQDLRRQTNAIDSPDCGKLMRNYVAIAMSYDIKTLMEFLSGKKDEQLTYSIDSADRVWSFAIEKLDEFKKEPVETNQKFLNAIPEFTDNVTSDSKETSAWKFYQMDGCNASFRYPTNIYEVLPLLHIYYECGVMFSNQIENGKGIIKIAKEDNYSFSQFTSDTMRLQSLLLFTEPSGIVSVHKEKLGVVTAYYYVRHVTTTLNSGQYESYSFNGVFITPNNEIFSFYSDGGQNSIENLYLSVAREILKNFLTW